MKNIHIKFSLSLSGLNWQARGYSHCLTLNICSASVCIKFNKTPLISGAYKNGAPLDLLEHTKTSQIKREPSEFRGGGGSKMMQMSFQLRGLNIVMTTISPHEFESLNNSGLCRKWI